MILYWFVLLAWTFSSFYAALGAAYLCYLALKDYRFVTHPTPNPEDDETDHSNPLWAALRIAHIVKRETSGILFRSGFLRCETWALATLLGVVGILHAFTHTTQRVDLVSGGVSIGLSVQTALFTARDLRARRRITVITHG